MVIKSRRRKTNLIDEELVIRALKQTIIECHIKYGLSREQIESYVDKKLVDEVWKENNYAS